MRDSQYVSMISADRALARQKLYITQILPKLRAGFGPKAESGMALLPVVVGRRPTARISVNPAASGPTLEIEMPGGAVRVYALPESFIAVLTRR